jgi:cellobiose transport system permease protein
MGTQPNSAVNQTPPVMMPGTLFFHNFNNALKDINFWGSLWNSLLVSVGVTVGMLFFCSLAGFAFAKFKFPLKNFLFVFLVMTMTVPHQLNLIPSYIVIVKINLLDTLAALIIPGLVSAFGIFWMKQYIETAIHDELLEAGWMDGCGNFRIFWNIVVPAILPALATLGILTFLNTWNDFMWPLVVLKSNENYTIQVTLKSLFAMPQDRDYGKIMAATFVATLPLIIVFVCFRNYFISGLTAGAVKS